MSVIDFRVRPLYKNYLNFTAEHIAHQFDVFGYKLNDSVLNRDVESLIRELDKNDVVKSVIPGRKKFGTSNEELFELAEQYPDHFIVFPFLDVTEPEQALADLERYILNGKGKGASLEPYVGNDWHFDDERIDPLYTALEENHIPVLVTVSGWVSKVWDNTIPNQVDNVLVKHPNLVFVAAHGGWPWFEEFVAIAYKHPNLYLTADFEGTRGVGADQLRYGALHMVKDQVVFASSYPTGPIGQGIESVRAWKLPKEIEQKVLYDTAAKILGI